MNNIQNEKKKKISMCGRSEGSHYLFLSLYLSLFFFVSEMISIFQIFVHVEIIKQLFSLKTKTKSFS